MLARAIDGTYFFNKDVDLDALEDVKSALTQFSVRRRRPSTAGTFSPKNGMSTRTISRRCRTQAPGWSKFPP